MGICRWARGGGTERNGGAGSILLTGRKLIDSCGEQGKCVMLWGGGEAGKSLCESPPAMGWDISSHSPN